jgi:acetoin utilization deacetylase AcuC-like enzyme
MFRVAWSENFSHPLPEGHRFPMIKYDLIPEQLIYEGTIKESDLFKPGLLHEDIIKLTHKQDYWKRLKNIELSAAEIRRTGFPLSEKLVERERCIMNGTLMAAEFALQDGVAFNSAGGTHHAFTNKGEGFCLLNDIAIAANFLLKNKLVKKILVADLDVHQGNGTAEIFYSDDRVFTFSMHGEKNYPMQKEKSSLDIGLPDKITDDAYLKILKETLPKLINEIQPDFIFYQSGVDVLATDKLGRLALSREGCRERDQIVFSLCKHNNIPVAVSMGGGYSEKISDIVEAHCNTYRVARELFF